MHPYRSLLLILFFGYTFHGAAQYINFKDIQLSQGYALTRAEANRFVFTYRIKSNSDVLAQYRKIEFDTLLQLSDTTIMYLRGDHEIIAAAAQGSASVHLFGSAAGTLTAHFTNSKTDAVKLTNLITEGWLRGLFSEVLSTPDKNGFIVLYQPDNLTMKLLAIDTLGNTRWSKTITFASNKTSLSNCTMSNDALHLVFISHHLKKKQKTEWRIFNLEDGKELQAIDLNKPGHKMAIDNLIGTSKNVYLIGREFMVKKIKQKSIGKPVIYGADNLRPNPTIMSIAPPASPQVFWMDLVQDAAGNPYLVGETFQSGSLSSYMGKGIATGILTMGLVSVTWNTMHFEQIAVMPVGAESISGLKTFPVEPRKIQLGAFLDPYSFAQYSYKTGQVRYFGNDNRGGIFLLNTPKMSFYQLGDPEPRVLGGLPEGFVKAIFVSNSYMISINESKLKGKVEIAVKKFTE